MTGLLTSLTDRVGRMEQWQSATGSTAGGGAASVGASSAMTPMTPQAQQSGWADVDQLNQQLLSLRMGDGSEGADPRMMMRPLTSTARILEGTFSSDSSETARRRAEEAQRGVPGALLGPLALADRPFFLEGDPMAVVQERGDGTQAVGAVVDQTVEAIMRSHAQDGLEPSCLGIAGPQNTSSLPRTTESQSMSSPPGITGPQSTSSLPRTAESQSMSSPPRMSEPSGIWPCSGMSEPQQSTAVSSLSMPPLQRVMESSGMPRPLTSMEPQNTESCLRSMGSWNPRQVSGLAACAGGCPSMMPTSPEERFHLEEAARRAWWGQAGNRSQGGDLRGNDGFGRYVGSESLHGSPMSVMNLPPPPPRLPGGTAMSGSVIGAPPQGLVYVQGVWQPYTMVQGQMVVQFEQGGNASGASPPPPPLPPPPTTPKVGTSGASSSTPGGTPVPPW